MNTALFRFINTGIKNPVLDAVMPLFSDKDYIVIPAIIGVVLALYFGSRRTRLGLVALGLALLVADKGSENVLKNIFDERRPYAELEGVNVHRNGQWMVYDPANYASDPRKSNSFPSSHAANAAAAAVGLALLSRRTVWAMAPLAVLVGLSRIYTGNHYPGDVLAGYLWGGLVAWGLWKLLFRLADANAVTGEESCARAPLSPERRTLFGLLALWTAVNFWFVYLGVFDLAGDEAQYWDWSRRLALGYYSKPPLIAYLMRLLTGAAGNKEWAIRSGAVLLSTGTLALVYALTLRIVKSERAALLAAVVALAMPSAWAGSVVMTIDAPLAFCWILAMYAFHRAVNGESRMWILTGVALGLGMLAKYTMAILILSFLAYLVLADRRHLKTAGPYMALGIMALMLSGVIYWNATNDWVSIKHTAAIGASAKKSLSRSMGWMGEFIGAQAGGLVSPILFGFFAWALWTLQKRFRTSRDAAFLLTCFWGLFGFYALVALTRPPQANWPACAYLAAIPAVAWVWSERERSAGAKRWLWAGVLLGCFLGLAARSTDLLYLAGIPFADNGRPDRVHLGPVSIDPDKDPTSKLRGGRELGEALSKYVLKGDPNAPFIMSDRYQLTAWAAFYTKGRPQTYCMNPGDRRYNQYDLWGGAEALAGRNAILVTGGDANKAAGWISRLVEVGAFKRGEVLEIVNVTRGRTVVKTFALIRLYEYTGLQAAPGAAGQSAKY